MPAERQRVDRWLWHARLVRTRALAAALAASGHVRINGRRVSAPARAVCVGDVLTVAMPSAVRVLRVAALTPRRGSAAEARTLYDDLSPPPAPEAPTPVPVRRDPGSSRPTKRERRALVRLRQRSAGHDD